MSGPSGGQGAPVITSASLARKRFRVGSARTPLSGTARKTPAGTTLRVNLSKPASLRVAIQRARPGRRKGGRCSPRVHTGRRCTSLKQVGALKRTLPAGSSKIPFSGRLGRRRLAAGSYRMKLVATDAQGVRSSTKTLKFTVVKR